MTPDIETRLRACIKALEHVVVPALAPGNPPAAEQTALVGGHLRVIAGQVPYATEHGELELRGTLALGEGLAAAAVGGDETTAAAGALRDTLASAGGTDDGPASSIPARRTAIARAIDALIDASGVDGDSDFRAASQRLVLEHGARQADVDRAWFAGTGMDPDAAALPSIPELVLAGRS